MIVFELIIETLQTLAGYVLQNDSIDFLICSRQ